MEVSLDVHVEWSNPLKSRKAKGDFKPNVALGCHIHVNAKPHQTTPVELALPTERLPQLLHCNPLRLESDYEIRWLDWLAKNAPSSSNPTIPSAPAQQRQLKI